DRRFRGEAGDGEVAAVHLEDGARVGTEGALVVGEVRAVRRADLAEARATLSHYFVHAEAAADLHQLAAREDRVAPVGDRVEGEHERRRAVVDDERVLR